MVSVLVHTRRSLLAAAALLAACGGSDADAMRDPAGLGGSGLPAPIDAEIMEPTPALDAGRPASDDGGGPGDASAPPSNDGGGLASDAGTPSDAGFPVSCPVEAPTSCPDPTAIRYADVAPIIEARCASCHSPLWSGPWPLNTLSHVRDWTDDIRTNLIACTMPPPDAGIPITKEERLTVLRWIRCGTPE